MPRTLLEKRLIPWRWLLALAALLLAAAPLLFPFLEFAEHLPAAGPRDAQRLGFLYLNTFALVAGTLILALPLGVLLAVLLFRTDLPARRLWQGLLLASLFLPLPLLLSAWQGLFGSDGWLPFPWWEARPGQPWAAGLIPAIWVHALAGLPWVAFLVGLSLTWVERELEEDALLRGPPWSVCLRVTLPRARGMIAVAAVFLILQTAGEIVVTDMFQVVTIAEEVYLQFALADRPALARAVMGSLPWVALLLLLIAVLAARLRSAFPSLDEWDPTPLVFPLRRARWPVFLLICAFVCLAFLLPLSSLVYKLGRLGPEAWSAHEALTRFTLSLRLHGVSVARMILLALVTGALIACLGLVAAWLTNGSRLWTAFFAALALLSAALPGPVIGVGLKQMILWIVAREGTEPFAFLFYDRGPWSVMWAQALRFWPYAFAVCWMLVRLIPRQVIEMIRLEGFGLWGEWRHVIWPLTRRPVLLLALLMTALCLGEVAASGRAETPGWETFSRLLFDRMHFGIDAEAAGLALVLLFELSLMALICFLSLAAARSR